MKVEKVREKDGKLELLVELSPAETAEEMQRAETRLPRGALAKMTSRHPG